MKNKNEKFISIEELIFRAKNLGVNFGNGNPKNRLRYFVKIGLFPHAQRKSFNGLPSQGVYPESALKILLDIDKKLKEGKSVLQIKREIEREKEENVSEISPNIVDQDFLSKEKNKTKILFLNRFSFFKISFFVLVLIITFIFVKEKPNFIKPINMFLATLTNFGKIVQAPTTLEKKENISLPPIYLEPFLTINAETLIRPKLIVEESISSPRFAITKDGFNAIISTLTLTADRTYNFPDLSGTICLSTGNCVGIGGEVVSPGGSRGRLVKFTDLRRIENASILDLFSGTLITINELGNIGIGTENPLYKLHVYGNIQSSGDICTDLAGGRCLSKIPIGIGGGGGIRGSGTTGFLPIWTSNATIGNSIVSQIDSMLNIDGTIRIGGFQLTSGAQAGYILTSDEFGFGTWQPAPTGTLPIGSFGQTIMHNGLTWIATNFLYNTGSAIGIGTTSPLATLTVAGSGFFEGPLTIKTSYLPQLILQDDDGNYLKFTISSTSSAILTSKTMVFNTLTGELKFFDTSLKKGDKILRVSIPILKFPIPTETSSTTFMNISKTISPTELNSLLPPQFEGSERRFALLINFADNIPTNASSTWKIDFLSKPDPEDIEFSFSGQALSSLEEGAPHLKDDLDGLLGDNWILKAKTPDNNFKIRIFNIFLLTYDKIQ